MSAARPPTHVLILFGASGDLARRKLLPGLFHLELEGLMPESYAIVGTSRSSLDDERFRRIAHDAIAEFGGGEPGGEAWKRFSSALSYASADDLPDAVARAEPGIGEQARRLIYLSVPPSAFGEIIDSLGDNGLAERARVVMEKPFGHDLPSARALNDRVHRVFAEEQVFRIDHFLGKEAAMNLLALRFANGMFEPVWNREHISHVQIDVPETLGIGDRVAFYEETGALRDMVVTHLLQLLGFVAMEPPTALEARPLGDERLKVFDTLREIDPREVVRGQYEGYREEDGVAPDSQTETLVALCAHVENWRWQGVPFYLRTGKRMKRGGRVITLAFRDPPRAMFGNHDRFRGADPNELVLDLSDSPTVRTSFLGKQPGPAMELGRAEMSADFAAIFDGRDPLEAYERLLLDAMAGDHTLFNRADGIERLWEVCTPVLEHPPPVRPYAPGSWGPPEARRLIAPHRWRLGG